MQSEQYSFSEAVIFKGKADAELGEKSQDSVDVIVTEGHLVVGMTEPVTIPLSRVVDFGVNYAVLERTSTITMEQIPIEAGAGLVRVITYADDSDAKQRLRLTMDAGVGNAFDPILFI